MTNLRKPSAFRLWISGGLVVLTVAGCLSHSVMRTVRSLHGRAAPAPAVVVVDLRRSRLDLTRREWASLGNDDDVMPVPTAFLVNPDQVDGALAMVVALADRGFERAVYTNARDVNEWIARRLPGARLPLTRGRPEAQGFERASLL